MLTDNIDTADSLTNGVMGTVRHVVDHDVNTPILVKFDNAFVRHVAKHNSKYKYISTSSVPIKQYEALFHIHSKRSVDASWINFHSSSVGL